MKYETASIIQLIDKMIPVCNEPAICVKLLAIAHPQYLVGLKCYRCIEVLIAIATDQITPAIDANQIDVREQQLL